MSIQEYIVKYFLKLPDLEKDIGFDYSSIVQKSTRIRLLENDSIYFKFKKGQHAYLRWVRASSRHSVPPSSSLFPVTPGAEASLLISSEDFKLSKGCNAYLLFYDDNRMITKCSMPMLSSSVKIKAKVPSAATKASIAFRLSGEGVLPKMRMSYLEKSRESILPLTRSLTTLRAGVFDQIVSRSSFEDRFLIGVFDEKKFKCKARCKVLRPDESFPVTAIVPLRTYIFDTTIDTNFYWRGCLAGNNYATMSMIQHVQTATDFGVPAILIGDQFTNTLPFFSDVSVLFDEVIDANSAKYDSFINSI